jgi:hypothetical protein
MPNILIDRNDYLELKHLYKQALRNDEEVFVWNGQDILPQYAKYLIEYLEMKGFK